MLWVLVALLLIVIWMRLFVLVDKSALGSPCFVADSDIDEVVKLMRL